MFPLKLHVNRLIVARWIGLLLLIVGLPSSEAFAQNRPQLNAPAPPTRFGAVEAYYRPAEATALGLGWERIVFEWPKFQPNGPDDWDTSSIPDEWLLNDEKANRDVVGLIKNAPHWATGSDLLGAPPLGLDKPIDDPDNTFAQFVTKLVRYYSQNWHIHHWIFYNEPDIRPTDTNQFEFSGDETDYYHVLKVGYLAAHQADPDAVIHLAGTTWWQDFMHGRTQFIERFLRVAQKDPDAAAHGLFFDVLSIHVYDQTEMVWRITGQLASLPASLGFPKPVWIDELNARPTSDGDWQTSATDKPVSLDQQADFLVQAASLGLALGVQRIAVYRLYDDVPDTDPNDGNAAWGLIRNDGSYRPAFTAWSLVIREFSATTSAQRFSNGKVTMVTLVQPDRYVVVLWNQTTNPITIHVPHQSDSYLLSPLGAEVATKQVGPSGANDEFILPPCTDPCLIEGEPRLLIWHGSSPAVYQISATDGKSIRLN